MGQGRFRMYRRLGAAAVMAATVALLLLAAGGMMGGWTAPAAVVDEVVVEANGASTLLYEGTQGPYRLVVGIIPARPVIPQTHLSMQVFDAAAAADSGDMRPLRDTDVQVTVAATGPPGSTELDPRPALNDQSIVYFEVDVPFDTVGNWQLAITVAAGDSDGDGSNGAGTGAGPAVFEIPLVVEEPRAGIQWLWVAVALAAILLVGLWTLLKVSRSGRAES